MAKAEQNTRTSKAQAKRLFLEGYRLAFESKKKMKPWPDIFAMWKQAAESGHVRAQFYLAGCYDDGLGVKKNISKAFDWYLKAAKKGKDGSSV